MDQIRIGNPRWFAVVFKAPDLLNGPSRMLECLRNEKVVIVSISGGIDGKGHGVFTLVFDEASTDLKTVRAMAELAEREKWIISATFPGATNTAAA